MGCLSLVAYKLLLVLALLACVDIFEEREAKRGKKEGGGKIMTIKMLNGLTLESWRIIIYWKEEKSKKERIMNNEEDLSPFTVHRSHPQTLLDT